MSEPGIQDICDMGTDAGRRSHHEHMMAAPQTSSTGRKPPSKGPSVLNKLGKWADYDSCCSGPVGPSRFLPMKTPLSEARLANWSEDEPPRNPWTVPLMLATQRDQGRPVGLLIDLSNHETLYAEDIPPQLHYRHIQLVAKEIPSKETVADVITAANEFWISRPEEFVAIHCAYGFNRTGFIVCSYLVEVAGLSIDEALDAFAMVRPPGVRHQDFVEELYCRYHADGTAFSASATASRAVKPPSLVDPAEPCQVSSNTAEQMRWPPPAHLHRDAIGNSTELAQALSDTSLPQASFPPETSKRRPISRSSNESCRTEEWLRRTSAQDFSTASSALQRALDAAATAATTASSPTCTGESAYTAFGAGTDASSVHAVGTRTHITSIPSSSPDVNLVESPAASLVGELPVVTPPGCGVEDSGGGMRWRSHQWLARLQAATEGLDHEDNESLQQDSVRSCSLSRDASGVLSPPQLSFSQRLVRMSPSGRSSSSTCMGTSMSASAMAASAPAFSPLSESAGGALGRRSCDVIRQASGWPVGSPAPPHKTPRRLPLIGSDDGLSPAPASSLCIEGGVPGLRKPQLNDSDRQCSIM